MTYKKLTLLLAISASLCLPSARGQSLTPVIMPGTDLMIHINLEKIRNAPIYLAMKAMKEKQKEAVSQSPLAGIDEADELTASICEMTGLETTDLLSLVAAVQLDGMDLENKPELAEMEALAGLKLGKELSIDKLEAGLNTFIAKQGAENGTTPPALSRVSHGDTVILQMKEAESDEPVYLSMVAGNKVLLFGSKQAVEDALDRYQSGNKISLGTIFPAAIGKAVGGSNSYVVLKPTADMLAKMKSQSEASMNPANAVMAQMKTVGIGVNFGETMDLGLICSFATTEAAKQASMLVDAQAISGIKMFATMMTGGAPLPMLETMKTEAGDTGTAWFKMSLAKADLDLISKAVEQKMQQSLQIIEEPAE